jgi:hypothetical protein
MSFLLMITQENVGYISLKLKVTHLINSKSIRAFIEKQSGKHIRTLRTLVEKLGIGKNSARVLKTSPWKNSVKKSKKLGKH